MTGVRRKRGQTNSRGGSATKRSSSLRKPSSRIDLGSNDLNDESSDEVQKVRKSGDRGDDEIDSGSDDDDVGVNGPPSSSDDESNENETVDAKRIRLARAYLEKIEQEGSDDDGDSSTASSSVGSAAGDGTGTERIGRRLMRERLKREGTLELMVASKVAAGVANRWQQTTTPCVAFTRTEEETQAKAWVSNDHVRLFRGHDLPPTCVALHMPSGDFAYSGSKDSSVLMWDIERECALTTIQPQWKRTHMKFTRGSGEVLSMACSDDGRYLAVGGRDALVKIYDIRLAGKGVGSNSAAKPTSTIHGLVTSFQGHKGPVTSLAFRSQSLQLFSGSEDRCIRHYSLEEMMYIETLYGHQAGVTAISCSRRERPFSVARDRTARAWKLLEDTHLIFRGGSHVSSADCIKSIKDDWFLTGHDDGNLSLWLADKKKPIDTVPSAHGQYTEGGVTLSRGISSCDVLGGSDFAATGSKDGYMRLWRVKTGQTKDDRGIEPLDKIPVFGYVNDIAIGPKARFCVAAVGQEHKLGRWDRVRGAKNRFAIIRLRAGDDNAGDETIDDSDIPDNENSVVDDTSLGRDSSDAEEED